MTYKYRLRYPPLPDSLCKLTNCRFKTQENVITPCQITALIIKYYFQLLQHIW
jgi:hypothetical protein